MGEQVTLSKKENPYNLFTYIFSLIDILKAYRGGVVLYRSQLRTIELRRTFDIFSK